LPKREPAGITITLVIAGATYSGWLVSPQREIIAFSSAPENADDPVVDRYGDPRCSKPRTLFLYL
jgi:hypothetical protein